MKFHFTLFISLISSMLFGQDTTYYNFDGYEVVSLKNCSYYSIVNHNAPNVGETVVRQYYKSGQNKSERYYKSYDKKILHGKVKEWYSSGQIRRIIDYKDGQLNGELLTYWDNGKIKRKDIYENGELLEGKVWNADGKEAMYYDYEILPEFPGGINGLVQYLIANLKYPKKSQKKQIEGRVLLNFVVEKDGSVSNIRVVESVNEEMDNEAIRVVKKMPKWSPGLQDGEKVKVHFNLPVKFSLK